MFKAGSAAPIRRLYECDPWSTSLGDGYGRGHERDPAVQDRLATAAAEIARQGAVQNNSANPPAKATSSASLPAQTPRASLPAQTPPNPGPPGGAHPADLAQAMMDEQIATHDVAANVKTVQAFDQMLEELSRLGRSTNTPSSSG